MNTKLATEGREIARLLANRRTRKVVVAGWGDLIPLKGWEPVVTDTPELSLDEALERAVRKLL